VETTAEQTSTKVNAPIIKGYIKKLKVAHENANDTENFLVTVGTQN
jgi:hypothetical protein